MIDSTSEEFVEYFESVEIGKEFLKKDLFESFKRDYEEYSDMEMRRFTKWLKDSAKIKGIAVNERKSGSERYIRLGEQESGSADKLDAGLFN